MPKKLDKAHAEVARALELLTTPAVKAAITCLASGETSVDLDDGLVFTLGDDPAGSIIRRIDIGAHALENLRAVEASA